MNAGARWRKIVTNEANGPIAAVCRSLAALLEPIYAAVVARKNRCFDSGSLQATHVGVPVISVGNLTVGGTGKTPMVVWLARWFRQRGVPVTILSRGYGAKSGKPNDEYQEIAAQLPDVPHLQNPDRVAAAREALARDPKQILILDDAFQHRRIARDFDLVLLDALDPFGAGRLLPRGLLREPKTSLARAQAVALSRADAVSPERREEIRAEVARLAPQAIWLELEHRPALLVQHGGVAPQPIELLRGRKVAAFCGIGNPAGFRHTLASCGAETLALREFADHFAYPAAEVDALERWIEREAARADFVVCTHKDLVKIPRERLAGKPLWAIQIAAAFRVGEASLEERLGLLLERLQ